NNDWDKTAQRKLKRMNRAGAKSLGMLERIRSRRQDDRVKELLALGFPRERIVFVEHHTAHASAAYYGLANFHEDILVLTADGSGDGVCASVSIGRKGRLERLHQIPMAHSLGNIYAMVTFLMGMVPLEHEYKVMGLAPYADPKGAERVFQKFMGLIRFNPRQPLGWEKTERCPATYYSYRFFRSLLECERFDWISGGLPRYTEPTLAVRVRNSVAERRARRRGD